MNLTVTGKQCQEWLGYSAFHVNLQGFCHTPNNVFWTAYVPFNAVIRNNVMQQHIIYFMLRCIALCYIMLCYAKSCYGVRVTALCSLLSESLALEALLIAVHCKKRYINV